MAQSLIRDSVQMLGDRELGAATVFLHASAAMGTLPARVEPRATNDLSLARVKHITNFLLFSFGREERPTARAISHQALVPQCEQPHLHVKVV
jgi:hypothetical protein